MQSSDKGFLAVVVNGTWPHPDVLETAERQVLERREAAEVEVKVRRQSCAPGAAMPLRFVSGTATTMVGMGRRTGSWLLGDLV